jgi:16S rRNA (cytidine1402-2'-O)-methyltransferase
MLSHKIKDIEAASKLNDSTQLFIETPYRNNQLISEILRLCSDQTRLCVASGLTGEQEKIISCTIQEWKKLEYNFHKIPAVFALYAN